MSRRLLCSIQFQTILLVLVILLYAQTLSVFGISIPTSTYFGGNATDHQALLAFKTQITRDPENIFSSWNDSLHFCEWEGVTCGRKHRRVTVLDLSARGLVGSLSPYIGNLSFTREIMLANNTIGGKIPDEVGRLFRLQVLWLFNNSFEGGIPANLSHCSNLYDLDVGENNLSGSIPMELACLLKLESLSLNDNNLKGGIPTFIGNLSSLKLLYIVYNNDLGGHIPDALGQLRSLEHLLLGGNKLSGMIPPSLYNLSSLKTISLPENKLSGSLPTDLFLTLPRLQWFQINENRFTGYLPVSLSNASELEVFEVGLNNFTGKFSVNFGGLKLLVELFTNVNNLGSGDADEMDFFQSLVNCSKLRLVDLYMNQFKGTLPKVWVNFTQLRVFRISENLIFGEIPSGIGSLVHLAHLWLGGNKFTGTIPKDIGNLQKLQQLYLYNNRFSGRLPTTLGNLSLLSILDLYNNKLQGTIPISIENCQNLLVLDLSQNYLSGTIPKQLFAISMLSISLYLSQNFFVGFLPSEVGNLVHLAKLDLSENKLFGKIPITLGSCGSLEYLYMKGNFFQGVIPTSLSSLRGIEDIDLSRNNLSGKIPNFLEKLSLKNLNLSYNNFEGEVPTKGVFTNASAVSIVGNSRLCGGNPKLKLPRCLTKEEKKTKWSLALKMVISMACVLLVVTIVSFFLFYCKKNRSKNNSLEFSLRQSLLQVSYQVLLKATDGFSLANLIGEGSFGSVYKGILGEDRTIVAVKVLNLQRRGASRSFVSECEALKNIRHRNLVKIITSCSSVDFHGNDFKALVYEFMPNASLENWLHMDQETNIRQVEIHNLNLLQRINIANDVACALDYLHHHCPMPIVHCDLKPSNILFDYDMTAHVGDFGLAKFVLELTNPQQSSSIGIRGTIGYTPPGKHDLMYFLIVKHICFLHIP